MTCVGFVELHRLVVDALMPHFVGGDGSGVPHCLGEGEKEIGEKKRVLLGLFGCNGVFISGS